MTDAQVAARLAEKWARHPWLFVPGVCLTKDETYGEKIKRFPCTNKQTSSFTIILKRLSNEMAGIRKELADAKGE